MGYDQGMIYVNNMQRKRYLGKKLKVVNTVNVDIVVY